MRSHSIISQEMVGLSSQQTESNDLHLKYGAHISCHDGTNDAATLKNGNFLPSFEHRSGLLLSEPDAYKIVIETLLGHTNDIFDLSGEISIAEKHFSLSYTARHMYLKGTSAKSLQPLLVWFAALATNMHVCRTFAYQETQLESSRTSFPTHSTSERRGDNMTVLEALKATVVDLIVSVEDRLCSLDANASVATERGAHEHTLIALYVSCRSWVPLFKTMSALVITAILPMPTTPPSFSSPPLSSTSALIGMSVVKEDVAKSNLLSFRPNVDSASSNIITDCRQAANTRREITLIVDDMQQEQMWQSLQLSGIMQSLFSLQRWRQMSNMKDSFFSSSPSSSSHVVFGGQGRATTNHQHIMRVNLQSTSSNYNCRSSNSNSGNRISSTILSTSDRPLDRCFSTHLYGGGLLSAYELEYFLSTLKPRANAVNPNSISNSILQSGRFHGSYEFFVGCSPGNEIDSLHGSGSGRKEGRNNHRLNCSRKREHSLRHRVRDCHEDQQSSQYPSSSSSSSSLHSYSNMYSDAFLNEETSGEEGKQFHGRSVQNSFNFFSNCNVLINLGSSHAHAHAHTHPPSDTDYSCKYDSFDTRRARAVEGCRRGSLSIDRPKEKENGRGWGKEWRGGTNRCPSPSPLGGIIVAHTYSAVLPVQVDIIDRDAKERECAARTEITNFMPLNTQLELTVCLPLRLSLASEQFDAVCTLRSRYGFSKLIKCKCSI